MGDEYIANLDDDKKLPLDKIANALCFTNRYVLVECSMGAIALRSSQREWQPGDPDCWPEDFRLCYDDGKLLLTIHGSTRQERTEIIHDIQSVFNNQNILLTFEEI
ncbi:MAG TPA: hypothetical protein VHG71_02325 [Verrucomicrobiae bacterium]|nr:hypothetical protein [Verrucomicrobiae bacterium]